jgi:DNA topoisomerase-1
MRHSSDSDPGYSRKRNGRYWQYFDEAGKRVTDRATIERLNAIGLPPAYGDAWYCKDPDGHIQATGKDARGRKQYRYHADFRARAEADKFDGCREFGHRLARLRRRVEQDLRRRKLTRDTVVAAVVRLLDTAYLRVGNEEYARDNKSFGATTLRSRHVRRKGRKLLMRFTGKHGVVHEHTISDARLARIVRGCQDLPGQALFQYLGEDGEPRSVGSADVNEYIRAATGCDFTAKHFRTWAASAIAFEQLMQQDQDSRISVDTMLEPVAEALGNTKAISRKSYVHPALVEAVKANPRNPLGRLTIPRSKRRLSQAETGLLAFLDREGRRATRRMRKPSNA